MTLQFKTQIKPNNSIYGSSLSLMTDLYQLTMAAACLGQQMHERVAVSSLYFRKAPFGGKYAIVAGLETAIQYLQNLSFTENDILYLKTLTDGAGSRLFSDYFLRYLSNFKFTCDIDAIPEGTVVFPNQPLVRVEGGLLAAQLVETALLNIINFQTLIATKAAHIVQAAQGDDVVEFGLRRAQGVDGGFSASRAAYIGGCVATSNVLAGKKLGIPVKGTHAHSWVMCFDNELSAFRAYAKEMPNNCIFLVDTYDTLEGVKNAIIVGKELEKKNQRLIGIRLDSGELATLSIEARKLLDEAGFHHTKIIASNDLDADSIIGLKKEGARIDTWGVGTNLVTGGEQSALGGVYKLSALKTHNKHWQDKIKLSENSSKTSIPGCLQVRRFFNSATQKYEGDMIYDVSSPQIDRTDIIHTFDGRIIDQPNDFGSNDLLEPIFRHGNLVYEQPKLSKIQEYTREQLSLFQPILANYPVGLEQNLYQKRKTMIEQHKK